MSDLSKLIADTRTTLSRIASDFSPAVFASSLAAEDMVLTDLILKGGYDIGIGVGATTPWQSCEAQDIVLRALDKHFVCMFDPSVYGHHAELDIRDAAMLRKGRAYARGLGHVLRAHGYPRTVAASWILRPTVRAMLSLARGDVTLFAYYRNVALGRYEGWRGRVPAQATAGAPKRAAPVGG